MPKGDETYYAKEIGRCGGPTGFVNGRERNVAVKSRYDGDGDVEVLDRMVCPESREVSVLLAKGKDFMRISVEEESKENEFDLPAVYLVPIAELGDGIYFLDYGERRHGGAVFSVLGADISRMRNFGAWGKRYVLREGDFQGDQRLIFDGVRRLSSFPEYSTRGYFAGEDVEELKRDISAAVRGDPKGAAHRNLFLLEKGKEPARTGE